RKRRLRLPPTRADLRRVVHLRRARQLREALPREQHRRSDAPSRHLRPALGREDAGVTRSLLVLAPVPASAAATRFRVQQFFPAPRARGIEPTLRPFLDEAAFAVLYSRGHAVNKLWGALRAVAGRLSDLVQRADAVLIQREAALVGPPLFEWLLGRVRRRP